MGIANFTNTFVQFGQMVGFPIALVIFIWWYENKRFKKQRESETRKFDSFRQVLGNQQTLINNYGNLVQNYEVLSKELREVVYLNIAGHAKAEELMKNINTAVAHIQDKLEKRGFCPLQDK